MFAFSAAPGQGSEPGGGWSIVTALVPAVDLTVLVKSEHIPAIRDWERRNRTAGLRFVEVRPRVPAALQKAHRVTEFLTYLSWLRSAERAATRLHLESPFDFAYHATYSVYWLPSPAVRMGIPSIWGPVGGGVSAPRTVLRFLGAGGLFDDLLDRLAVRTAACWPGTRRTWRGATLRIAQNPDTILRLPPELREASHVLNAGELTRVVRPRVEGRRPVVIFPSALISRKCPRLALEALVHAPDVRLQFAHGGPLEPTLRRLARRLGVAHRVDFLGKIPRPELFERLAQASAALFTGVREEGGLALAEALSLGTPVVVLSVGGARTLCRAAPDPTRVALVDPYDPRGVGVALGSALETVRSTTRGRPLSQPERLGGPGAADLSGRRGHRPSSPHVYGSRRFDVGNRAGPTTSQPLGLGHGRRSMMKFKLALWGVAAALAVHPSAALAQSEGGGGGGAEDQLVAGDMVRLTFWLDQDLSGDYVIDERGELVLPLIGRQQATGRSPLALKDGLRTAYQSVLRNQDVQILLLRRIRVLGEVRRPGLYHAELGMTVGDVLALAEGFEEHADDGDIQLLRQGQREAEGLDPTLVVGEGLRSGDQLFVPKQSWFRRNATAVLGTAASITVALIYRGFSR